MPQAIDILKDTVAAIDASIILLQKQRNDATRQIKRLEGSAPTTAARKGKDASAMVLKAYRKRRA